MYLPRAERHGNGPADPSDRGAKGTFRKKEVYAGGEEWIGRGS